jgi:putative tricarboxylic transport membrane protein
VRRGRQAACVGLLAVFIAAIVTSLDYSLFDALGPGPGFFPFWLSMVGVVLTIGILIEDARTVSAAEGTILPRGAAAWQAAAVLLALAATAVLLEPLGFRVTMLLFTGALLLVLGARSIATVALVSIAGSFGVFHLFYHWLKVPLPVGPFGI